MQVSNRSRPWVAAWCALCLFPVAGAALAGEALAGEGPPHGEAAGEPGLTVRFDPAEGGADAQRAFPTSFRLETGDGVLEGLVLLDDHASTLWAWHAGERLSVELWHRSVATPDGEVRVSFSSAGTLRYRLTRRGELELIGHDVADCSRLAESRLYRLLETVFEEADSQLAGAAIDEQGSWRALLYGWLHLARLLPSMLDACRDLAPDAGGGRCVINTFYDDCAVCCGGWGWLDTTLGIACGFTRIVRGPYKKDVCESFTFARENCIADHCEGKSGDPTPRRCGEENDGMCKNTCWTHHDEIFDPIGVCDSGHRCCMN